MMREIKFRAWFEDKYYEVASIDWTRKRVYLKLGSLESMRVPFSLVVLEQYTELKDKNGKEIYEGDIVNGEVFGYREHIVQHGEYDNGQTLPEDNISGYGWYIIRIDLERDTTQPLHKNLAVVGKIREVLINERF